MDTTTDSKPALVKLAAIPAARLQQRLFNCLHSADESRSQWQRAQHYERAETYWAELVRRGYAMRRHDKATDSYRTGGYS